MKKNYLRNFLIFSCTTLSAQNLYAQTADNDRFSPAPIVNIGGFINASSGFRSQDGAYGESRLPDAQVGANYETTGTRNRMNNNIDLTNEAEIHIKVSGINEYGMKYGAVVELEANTSTSARNEGFNADKAFIFTESRMGKLELGNNSAVNHKMKVGPETFARGAGGINGKYLEYINLPMLADSSQVPSKIGNCDGYRVDSAGNIAATVSDCTQIKLPSFILIPESPIAHGGYAKGFYNVQTENAEYSSLTLSERQNLASSVKSGEFGSLEDASKVSYYTPRMSGWQLGVSLTPDTGNSGTSSSISGDNSGDIKNAISYGVNYSENFGNVGLAFSATGESGKYEQSNSSTAAQREGLQAFDVGVMASFFGVTVGGSYGSWGKSLQPKTGIYSCDYDQSKTLANQTCVNGGGKFSQASYQTAGIAYQFGPIATSVTYLNSSFQSNQYNALSFGVDYKMAKGLMPYVEVTKYDFESNQPKTLDVDQSTLPNEDRQLKDNGGYVILAGLLFSF